MMDLKADVGAVIAICVIALAAVGIIIFVATKFVQWGKGKNITVANGKVTVGTGADMSIIAVIDESTKKTNRAFVDEQRDVLEYDLPDFFPAAVRLLTASKVRIPLYQSISENHFTKIFSNQDEYVEWRGRLMESIHSHIRVLVGRCRMELSQEIIDYYKTPEFEQFLERAMKRVEGQLRASALRAVNEKLSFYQRMPDTDRKKELVDKTEFYQRCLNEVRVK
jgi:hypothetical protein